jgi:hypothetical protein
MHCENNIGGLSDMAVIAFGVVLTVSVFFLQRQGRSCRDLHCRLVCMVYLTVESQRTAASLSNIPEFDGGAQESH